MYNSLEGGYSALGELMNYFHFEVNIYYILLVIVFINFMKALCSLLRLRKNKDADMSINALDIVISILSGVALFNALIFQGVLADISTQYSQIWFSRVAALCIGAFILFVLQVFFICKVVKYIKKDR